jgi:hypothetical protein
MPDDRSLDVEVMINAITEKALPEMERRMYVRAILRSLETDLKKLTRRLARLTDALGTLALMFMATTYGGFLPRSLPSSQRADDALERVDVLRGHLASHTYRSVRARE